MASPLEAAMKRGAGRDCRETVKYTSRERNEDEILVPGVFEPTGPHLGRRPALCVTRCMNDPG